MPVIPRVICIVVLASASLFSQVPHRPFMLVSPSDYDSLRTRATRWPWSVMKARAIDSAEKSSRVGLPGLHRKTVLTHDLGSACALAFVLDPDHNRSYLERVEHDVRGLIHEIRVAKETSSEPAGHEANVGPSHAAFMIYLLMDIMYHDLDSSARKAMENDCDFIASHHQNSWLESKYAIEGMMELYHHGATDEFRKRMDTYKNYLLSVTSPDGIYSTGPGYAYSRLYMKDRAQKKMFMDVCEYQGFDEFYKDPRFQHLYEWLFGYSVTPFNRTYTFGDSPPTKTLNEFSAAVLRAGRFSPLAAGYAAWYLGKLTDASLDGGLLQYLMLDGPQVQARPPVSRVFPNGGAWLLQREYGTESLAGVLWNVATTNESHGHLDVNSMNIVGFGEQILRNSGYDDWKEPDSAGWEWIHHDARSSNTLTIEGLNHAQGKGGGISEGVVGSNVEYACGESGQALANGSHSRSLVFIQPRGGLPGYFIVFDEAQSRGGQADVNMYFHPNSQVAPQIVEQDRDYLFRIKSCFTSNAILVRLVFPNTVKSISVRDGYFGSNEECNRFPGKYLDVRSVTDTSGESRWATLILPSLTTRPFPHVERLSTEGGEWMTLPLDSHVSDHVAVPDGDAAVVCNGIETHAAFAYWREVDHSADTYFVKKGTKWIHRTSEMCGFESACEVSVIMSGGVGEIVSPGSSVTFYQAGLRQILLDGSPVTPLKQGKGSLSMIVPAGNHHIALIGSGVEQGR